VSGENAQPHIRQQKADVGHLGRFRLPAKFVNPEAGMANPI